MHAEKYINRIHFLYVMPSFVRGMARLIDPFGYLNNYNEAVSPEEADYQALLSDWAAVGDDLEYAITEYENTLPETLE